MRIDSPQLKEKEREFLLGEARRIINLLKKEFLLVDGSLCLEKTGNIKRPFHVFHDLGDFIPFFPQLGQSIPTPWSTYRESNPDPLVGSQMC